MRLCYRIGVIILAYLLSNISVYSQVVEIDFHDDFKEAKAKAKAEGKHVLVYVYSDYCNECVEMEKYVFTKQDVRTYFTKNYISVKLHIRKNGKHFAWKHKVKLYPTFLFFNKDGKELHRVRGFLDETEFILASEESYRNPKDQYKSYAKQYRKRKKDPEFLLEYLGFAERMRNNRLIDQLVDEIVDRREIVDEVVWMDMVMSYVYKENSKLFKVLIEHKESFYEKYGKAQVKKRILEIIVDSELSKISYNKLDKLIIKNKQTINQHNLRVTKDELFPIITNQLREMYIPDKNYDSLAKLYVEILSDYSEKVDRKITEEMINVVIGSKTNNAQLVIAEKALDRLIEEDPTANRKKLKLYIEQIKTH